jgi:hypothetical protein
MRFSFLIIILLLCNLNLFSIENLKNKSLIEAFEIIHKSVKTYYPFIEHKRINLDSLYSVTSNKILKAEKENNDTAYFIAIREYAHALKDNHAFAKRQGFRLYEDKLSGHIGFEILQLDNGDIVISQIRGGVVYLPEYLKVGTKILKWNNTPIKQAVYFGESIPLISGKVVH